MLSEQTKMYLERVPSKT